MVPVCAPAGVGRATHSAAAVSGAFEGFCYSGHAGAFRGEATGQTREHVWQASKLGLGPPTRPRGLTDVEYVRACTVYFDVETVSKMNGSKRATVWYMAQYMARLNFPCYLML